MKNTTDLWFASFLVELKGYAVINFENTSKNRGRFFFQIDDATWHKLKLEFNNSDLAKIKQGQEKLKDLVF
jgi:hypothetical protein